MIKDLQDAPMGDQGRLAYIMKRIEDGRSIYNSDEQYVRYKFKHLRGEITSESKDESEQPDVSKDTVTSPKPDTFEDIVTSPPPDPQPAVPHEAANDRHPSKAWYILPIFLWLLGGIIAFAALRKRHRGMAYKNLGLGIGLTMLLVVPLIAVSVFDAESVEQHIDKEVNEQTVNTPDSKSDIPYTNEEIKRRAVSIPYEALVEQIDTHTGEIVRYEGTIVQVLEHPFNDEYVLRVGLVQERFGANDIVWLNYKPVSDEDRMWLGANIGMVNPFDDENAETVSFFGILKGLREYETLVGNIITIPEIDVLILERIQYTSTNNTGRVDPEPQELLTTSEPASNQHTVSYDDVPVYADEPTVERAISDATRVWDMANTGVDFTIVESDADVNIRWARYMPGSALGLHSAIVTDDGNRERHSITVRLGIDDCHSTYQPFTHKTIQYTVAHEIGHYLGLRHVDDKMHLMYSGEFFDVDSIRVYDDRNLGIPHVERPEISTVAGVKVQAEIDLLNEELEQVSVQRQSLKNTADTEALDANTNTYNGLVQRIQDLKDQLACVDIT